MSLQSVVMAAGRGRRLRPLTDRWAKPVLPIDGRPVIATLLRELAAAGTEIAWVVVGHHARQVEALLDPAAFGLDIRVVPQPRPDGSADTVCRAIRAGAVPPLLVTAADTVYRRGDPGLFAAEAANADGGIAVRRNPPPGPGRAAVRIEDGRIVKVLDDDPANPLGGAPLWLVSERLLEYLEGLPGPPFELAELFQRGVDAGLEIVPVEIGKTRDLTDPLDLVKENFPYAGVLRDE